MLANKGFMRRGVLSVIAVGLSFYSVAGVGSAGAASCAPDTVQVGPTCVDR